MICIHITPGAPEPIYQQITAQISQAIAKGELQVDEKLPTVRKLALELVVNPNTVARAYSILEQQGLVYTKVGAGTFIANPQIHQRNLDRRQVLQEKMELWITEALNMGLKREDIVDMLQTSLEKFPAAKGKAK